MSTWQELGRQGLRGALETRRRAGVARSEPVCVYDVAERLNIEVRFHGGNSFGGMYAKPSKTILVPALRPAGRQAFTCAHEMAHWFYGHGSQIDLLEDVALGPSNTPEERLANIYASFLLMPPWAVDEMFSQRGWSAAACTHQQVYAVACQLGVGYETLIQHMRWSLETVSTAHAEALLKAQPKQLRQVILGHDRANHLVVADKAWSKVAIDLQVGDAAIIPSGTTIEGQSVIVTGDCNLGLVIEGVRPGITRAASQDGAWSTFIRVRRKDFVGRAIYRHLEDPDA